MSLGPSSDPILNSFRNYFKSVSVSYVRLYLLGDSLILSTTESSSPQSTKTAIQIYFYWTCHIQFKPFTRMKDVVYIDKDANRENTILSES